jgi:hypothetical protein
VVSGVGERSNRIRVMSSHVKETRNHVRETSSDVGEKNEDYWAVVWLYRFWSTQKSVRQDENRPSV